MANYREILRLASLNYSQLEIASSLKCSRKTISEVLNQAKTKGIAWLIIECSEEVSLKAICEQMGRTPPWIEGLLLRADG